MGRRLKVAIISTIVIITTTALLLSVAFKSRDDLFSPIAGHIIKERKLYYQIGTDPQPHVTRVLQVRGLTVSQIDSLVSNKLLAAGYRRFPDPDGRVPWSEERAYVLGGPSQPSRTLDIWDAKISDLNGVLISDEHSPNLWEIFRARIINLGRDPIRRKGNFSTNPSDIIQQ